MRFLVIVFFLFSTSANLFAQQKPLFNVNVENSVGSKEVFEEVKSTILQNYYYDGITEDDLYRAAINGMLKHISPPETPSLAKLWTDEEYENILNSLKGVSVSLGFQSTFNSSEGSLKVTGITEGADATKFLQINDRVVRINDRSLKGLSSSEVNGMLNGDEGVKVKLKVVRDIEVFDVDLVRKKLKNKNLIVTNIADNKALIEIKKISLGVSDELKGILENLTQQGRTSIIIDLRNNGGGVLNEGVNIAKLFLRTNEIALRTQARSGGVINYVPDVEGFLNFKIAVLINENTASSAEIIARALQEHKRAITVGKKTYGKGVIETTFTLSNNYRLKIISNAMYSPSGKSWQSKGVFPDYFIDQTPENLKSVQQMEIDQRMRSDLHLSTAVKLLGN